MFFKITTTTRSFLLLLSLKLFLYTFTMNVIQKRYSNCNKKCLNAVLAFNFFLMFSIVYFGVVTHHEMLLSCKSRKIAKKLV